MPSFQCKDVMSVQLTCREWADAVGEAGGQSTEAGWVKRPAEELQQLMTLQTTVQPLVS